MVTRTVHWLNTKPAAFIFKHEQILFVLLVVTRDLPKSQIENVRCNNFTKSSESVLISHEFNQFVIDERTFFSEESTSWRVFMIHE